jgi:transglutaminase-like putative cysteine protease
MRILRATVVVLLALAATVAAAAQPTAQNHDVSVADKAPAAVSGWPLPLFTSDPREVYQAAKQIQGPRDQGAFIVDISMNVRVEESGRAHWLQRSVMRVVDDRGVRMFGTLVVPWVSWRQERPRIRARVITRDGRAHELDGSTIADGGISHGSGQLLTDTRAISAALPGLQNDSVLEVELEVNDKNTLYPGGQLLRYPVTQNVSVMHYRVEVEAPSNSPFQVSSSGLDPAGRLEERTAEGRRVIFEGRNVAPPHPKAMLSSDQQSYPIISISSGVTWRNLASWYSAIVDERAGKQEGVRVLAPPDSGPKIAAILADIQANVRYTGFELGAAAYMPRPAEETLRRGFGDCKDKSVLLVSRLRKEGIPAYLALLTPFPSPDVNPDLPGIEGFTHAIVYVPGSPPVWIDPTAEFTPASRLPYQDQGRWALVTRNGTTQLLRTPESRAEENVTRFKVTMQLAPEGEGSFDLKEEETGAFEELMRPIAALNPERVREQKTGGLRRKVNVELGDPRDLGSPYRMSVYGEGYDAARTEGPRAWADVSPLGVDTGFLSAIAQDTSLLREPSESAQRTQDYCFPVVFTEEMEKHVIPPPGYRLNWPPAMPWHEIGPLTLERSVHVQPDGSVILNYRLVSNKKCYTPQEARTIAQEIHTLLTSRDATIRIEFFK